jgi:hypothetical protein
MTVGAFVMKLAGRDGNGAGQILGLLRILRSVS